MCKFGILPLPNSPTSAQRSKQFPRTPQWNIAQVPSQVIDDVPENVPSVLLLEYLANPPLKRSPDIGKIRNLRPL
ncbi:hypothetical protein DF147_35250 [Burkholderia cenocepacia]|nr:hypothetical protein DF147_35250 [Burkholderia cenocepacia]RQU79127.1 hypothetical protein DF133_35150 [Burkholderia cenocepacia]RQV19875.1 hypothetical protein DF030_23505 [Burkholderia cenocepacia]RQV79045.1 hypothetical protein DF019_35380 [Burkholderia cenocepacia]